MHPPSPDALTPDELSWHRTLMIQQRAVQLAVQLWSTHLAQKYQLQPGDDVDDLTGLIARAKEAGGGVS